MNTIEHAVARPFPEVIIDRGVRRKISWQLPPLATRAIYIADCVEHLAHVCLALASACAGRRDHRLDDYPLLVGDITRITSNSRLVHLALFVRPHGSPLLFAESAAIDRITGDSYGSRTFDTGSKEKKCEMSGVEPLRSGRITCDCKRQRPVGAYQRQV